MRSLFKISLAVLALAFLVVAGSVYAQDSGMQKPTLQITGIFNTSFGQVSYDKGTAQSAAQTTGAIAQDYKAYSEWSSNFETRLRAIYGTDDLNIRIVFRPKGGNSGTTGSTIGGSPYSGGAGNGVQGVAALTNLYAQADWKPLKPLMISFGILEGPSQFGALTDSYMMVGPVYNGNENWYNWTGRPGVVAQWDAGMIQAGVGLSSSCQPSCGQPVASGSLAGTTSAASGAPTAGPAINSVFGIKPTGSVTGGLNVSGFNVAPTVINTQTLTPYVTGKVGDITFRAQLPMTQGDAVGFGSIDSIGTANPYTKTVNGSGLGAAVAWTGMPGLMVAFDYYSFTDSKNSSAFEAVATKGGGSKCLSNLTAAGGACADARDSVKDITTSSVALKANYMGFNVFWMDMTVDNGRSDCTTSVTTFTNGSATDANGFTGGKSCKYDNTWITLSYSIPVGAGFIVPTYEQVTLGHQGQFKSSTSSGNVGSLPGDYNISMFRLVGRIVF